MIHYRFLSSHSNTTKVSFSHQRKLICCQTEGEYSRKNLSESIDLRCCFSQDHLLEYQTVSKYNARFDGLQAGTSYDIQISTELAGKTVVQTRHTFKTVTDTQEETRTDQN